MTVNNKKKLNVYFPTVLLNKEKFVDPSNLEYIYEYYLLENLAVNLVKDQKDYYFEYAPQLASSWELIDNKFILKINDIFSWSDGTKISLNDIQKSLKNSIASNSRHLVLLNKVESILINEDQNQIELVFNFRPDVLGLLHELSLADSSIVSIENLRGNWSVTSGAYFLLNNNLDNNNFELKKNEYYKSRIDYPENVYAIFINGRENISKLNSKFNLDLVYLGGQSYKESYDVMSKDYSIIEESYPASIHMFLANLDNRKTQNEKLLKEVSQFLKESIENKKYHKTLINENQLIPKGYLGRLDNFKSKKALFETIREETILVELDETLRDLPAFKRDLESNAKKMNFKLEFKYSDEIDENNKKEIFYHFYSFKGNMKDPIGSFSFLLKRFKNNNDLVNRLNQISMESNEVNRRKQLEKFHHELLVKGIVLPLYRSPTLVLLKENINISNWNRFDMRMRFFEIIKE